MTASTLVLYDTTGQWGWLGELYAIMSANLASHFGSWTAMPVASYKTGLLKQYTATIYVGSTYDEPLPTAFLDDVYATTTPVIWAYDNIWQLTARYPNFSSVYGWNWSGFDFSSVAEVDYPLPPSTRTTQKLKRYAANAAGIIIWREQISIAARWELCLLRKQNLAGHQAETDFLECRSQ